MGGAFLKTLEAKSNTIVLLRHLTLCILLQEKLEKLFTRCLHKKANSIRVCKGGKHIE